jgi:sugar lactone lactonase YvrE
MGQIEIIKRLPSPGNGPVGLAYDGRYLWNADFNTGKIYRLDPATGEEDIVLVCPGNLSGLAWDGRALWQSLYDGGTLRRINPDTNDFDQTIMVWEHGWISGVTWDGKQLWALSQQHGKIFSINHESGELLATIPAPNAGGGLDYHDGSLWMGFPYPMRFDPAYELFEWEGEEQHFALARLDPADGRELARYTLDFVPMGVAWAGDSLWLSHLTGQELLQVRLQDDE